MQFQTLTYLIFLAVVFCFYWFLPLKMRKLLLFAASTFFYCWFKWEYGFLVLAVILLSFYSTKLSLKYGKSVFAWASIVILVLVLGLFKYTNFFISIVNDLKFFWGAKERFDLWNIILPLGISFFTFEAISYVVDCMRDPKNEAKSFLDYTLFIIFWPHLVAGPIMRAQEMIPQFNIYARFNSERVKAGIRRIINGLFLKLVLADNIAGFVNEGFHNYLNNTMLDNWSLAFAFGFQIYFDFAGYSSIAVGSAELFGLKLVENFNFPYAAINPRDFWRRWHISLSSWIRDYLYLPLTGQSVGISRSSGSIDALGATKRKVSDSTRSRALFISWAIMGFWHGANWTFIAWGLWHALVIQLYRFYVGLFPKIAGKGEEIAQWYEKYWKIILTMIFIMPGWIFFRADTLPQAFHMLGRLIDFSTLPRLTYLENYYLQAFLFMAGFFVVYSITKYKGSIPKFYWLLKAAVYAIMLIAILGYFENEQQFIYFQF